jgi:hypothetical protein
MAFLKNNKKLRTKRGVIQRKVRIKKRIKTIQNSNIKIDKKIITARSKTHSSKFFG